MRAAALGAFRRLLECAGPGDALAFVVPGASIGLAKALTAAGMGTHRSPTLVKACAVAV